MLGNGELDGPMAWKAIKELQPRERIREELAH